MRIEFLADYPPYRLGQVVDHPHPGAADVLVRRGIARPAATADDTVKAAKAAKAVVKKGG